MDRYFLIFVIAGGALLGAEIFLFWRIFRLEKKLKNLFSGSKGGDLEDVLLSQLNNIKELKNDVAGLQSKNLDLGKMAAAGIQKVGMVRYNAFGESGGDQSFAVAFMNAADDGVVISSLFGRGGFRAYAKPIKKGQSDYQLTDEEKKALEKAKEK